LVSISGKLVHDLSLQQAAHRGGACRHGMQRRREGIDRHGGEGLTSTAGEDSSTSTGQGSSQLDVDAIVAAATGLTAASLTERDVVGDDLITAMGLSEALGDDADEILGLADDARSAAVDSSPGRHLSSAPAARGCHPVRRRRIRRPRGESVAGASLLCEPISSRTRFASLSPSSRWITR
jgi:hypothetical protein